jgi:hypothetical protein
MVKVSTSVDLPEQFPWQDLVVVYGLLKEGTGRWLLD